jgi:nucleotide-binding universal stress UspA family protein
MTYKTVLVHAEGNPATAPRLAAAAAVARKFDANLLGLGCQMLDWVTISDPYGMMSGELLTMMGDQMALETTAAEKLFRLYAAATPNVWMTATAAPAEEMSRLARGADLIVAGGAPPRSGGGANQTADTVDLVLQSGRPVLIAPPESADLAAKQILVAWKDTREARRALTDALPFLKQADEVVVVEICDPDSLDAAKAHTLDVAAHLKRHGVTARSLAKIARPDAACDELNGEARACGADLIVSGAYGHARMQEWVLGGVTRDLLQTNIHRYLLLSH